MRDDFDPVGAVEERLLQRGIGLAFIGRHYAIAVEGAEHSTDLLYFHLRLRRLVAVGFAPETLLHEPMERMKTYLAALDDLVRHEDDGPSIGILVGRSKDRVTVEYANRNWTGHLPRAWRGCLPTPEDFEEMLRIRT